MQSLSHIDSFYLSQHRENVFDSCIVKVKKGFFGLKKGAFPKTEPRAKVYHQLDLKYQYLRRERIL